MTKANLVEEERNGKKKKLRIAKVRQVNFCTKSLCCKFTLSIENGV